MSSWDIVLLTYWLLSFVAGITTSSLAIFVWRRRPSQTAITLGVYLFCAALWSFAYCFQLRALTLNQLLFWGKVQYVGPAGVSLAGLIFVLQYLGMNEWVRPRWIFLLSIVPALTQVLVWTNEMHGLIWRSYWVNDSGPYLILERTHGPWFWVFLIYGYGLYLMAMGLLARVLFQRSGIFRRQAGVLLMGCIVPFVGNALNVFGGGFLRQVDLTVFGFSITGLSMAWGLFRFQLPVIMPLARKTVLEAMSDGVIALDSARNIVEVNPEACNILGRPAAQLIGRPAATLFTLNPKLTALCEAMREDKAELTLDWFGPSRRFEVKCSLLTTSRQKPIGLLIVMRDITDRKGAEAVLLHAQSILEQRIAERTAALSRTIEELRVAESELIYSAHYDILTGLANRKLFLHTVSERTRISPATDAQQCAVFYLDIDRFKIYNDGYGHHVGDLILVEISRRLQSFFGSLGTVARMGGDEFTIWTEQVENAGAAYALAQGCLLALALPARIAGNDIQLTASIGIALGNSQRLDTDEMIRDADLAMYRAKRLGGNQAILFGNVMRSAALAVLQLEQDLRQALDRGELMVQYQPFVRLDTGVIVGFEALVRWLHPRRGLLLPAEFLPLAEEAGLLIAVDEFVLREACRQKANWKRALPGLAEALFVSVNVAGWQLVHPLRWKEDLLALQGDTSSLRLEMMESILTRNAHGLAEFFEQVRTYDLHIYLDDFGTGYSSLSWLSQFPIRSLKIDKSFVQGIAAGGKDISIVRSIVALARSLDMEVVAEGIEDAKQCSILRDLGCEYGQGFYFSPPVDAIAAMELVRGRQVVCSPLRKASSA